MVERGGASAWEAKLAADLERERQERVADKEAAAPRSEQQAAVSEAAERAEPEAGVKEAVVEIPFSADATHFHLEQLRAQRENLESHLSRLGSALEDEPERQFLAKAIEQLDSQIATNFAALAKDAVDRLRSGEVLSDRDHLALFEDLDRRLERSAWGEVFVARLGFKTFQGMLDELRVKTVRYEDVVVELQHQKNGNWLERFLGRRAASEHIRKLKVSGGISVATASAIALFGGPVSWAGIGLGLMGGTGFRLAGEGIRQVMLRRNNFGERVAQELLANIYTIRAEGANALKEAGADQAKRAAAVSEILQKVATNEVASAKEYQTFEKRMGWVKAALGFIGAAGGAAWGAGIQLNQEIAQQLQGAEHVGIKLDLDQDDIYHEVFKNNDGAWRFMLSEDDPARFYPGANITAVGPAGVDSLLYQFSAEQLREWLAQNEGPSLLFHSQALDESAIREAIAAQISSKAALTSAIMAAPFIGEKIADHKQIADYRAANRPLIDYLEAESVRLKKLVESRSFAAPPSGSLEITPPSDFSVGDEVVVKRRSGELEPGWKILKFIRDEDGTEGAFVVSPDGRSKKEIPLDKLRRAQQPVVGAEGVRERDEERRVEGARYPYGYRVKVGGGNWGTVSEIDTSGPEPRYRVSGYPKPDQGEERFHFWFTESELQGKAIKSHKPTEVGEKPKEPDSAAKATPRSRERLPLTAEQTEAREIFNELFAGVKARELGPDQLRGVGITYIEERPFYNRQGESIGTTRVIMFEDKHDGSLRVLVSNPKGSDEPPLKYYLQPKSVREGGRSGNTTLFNPEVKLVRSFAHDIMRSLQKAKPVEPSGPKPKEEPETASNQPPEVTRGPAIWKTSEHDQPVVVTGYLGERNGRQYVSIEGTDTGIPLDEISYESREEAEEKPVKEPETLDDYLSVQHFTLPDFAPGKTIRFRDYTTKEPQATLVKQLKTEFGLPANKKINGTKFEIVSSQETRDEKTNELQDVTISLKAGDSEPVEYSLFQLLAGNIIKGRKKPARGRA